MGAYRKGLCLSIVSMVVLIFLAIPSVAQLPTGTILGVAKDSSGGVLPNVTVTVTNADTGLKRTLMTGDDGSYRVPELPVGRYEVRGEHAGFKTETRRGITLEVTQQAVVNLDFEVGSAEQQVVVTGEASIVNTQNATLGGLVTEQNIENLPLNGRNYVDLSLLQPGVSPDRNIKDVGTSFSVNGAPPRSNNFTLDGAILQNSTGRNPAAGESGDSLGVDGIKEYRIVTGIFQAEYGMAMGSQMVAVSKGGTNQFHGDVFEYLRNSRLDAKNFFDDKLQKIPEFQRNQFGGAFGGPIKKDKTFFFGVFEGLRENLGTTNNNFVPSAGCHGNAGDTITLANCPDLTGIKDNNNKQIQSVILSQYTAPFLALAPLPTTPLTFKPDGTVNLGSMVFGDHNRTSENYGQMRVDQNFSSSDMLFGRYTIDNAILDQTVGDYSYFHNLPTARNQWITLAENHIFSTSVLNTARFSFSRTRNTRATHNVGLPNGGLGPAIVTGFPTGVVDMNGSAGGTYSEFGSANNYPEDFDIQNIYTLSDDFLVTRGKHAFKFGVLLNRFNNASQANNSGNGQIQFQTFADFLQSQPQVVEFRPTFANENRFYIYNTYGFYGQDDWRVTQRLTLNLGFRYEFMNTPHELNGKVSRLLNNFTDSFTLGPFIKNNTLHDFSPRVGLAYDLFGNGKTAIHAGAGVYYDLGNIGSVLGENTVGAPPFSGLIDIVSGSTPSVTDWETTLNTTGFPFPIPQKVINFYDPAHASAVTPSYMDYNFKSPYMVQYTASVQQQLPWDMALGVAYVGNHGVHLPSIRDGNPVFPTRMGTCGDPASLCVNGAVPFWDNGDPINYHPVNPNISSSINVATFATSRYNGMQIVLNKRTSHGLEFQGAYTRSLVTDDTQGQENTRDCAVAGGLLGVYPLDSRTVDTGPACFNIKNNWEISVTYHLPDAKKGNAFLAKMLSGWEMSSIVSIESGQPFSLITQNNRSNSGVLQGQQGDRVNANTPALIAKYFDLAACTSTPGHPAPNPAADTHPCPYIPIPYDPKTVILGDPAQWFNTNMFSIPPVTLSPAPEQPACISDPINPCDPNTIGQLGTSKRDFLPGPPSRNWDFSLVKETKLGYLGEAGMIQFRAEFFNILNHPNFGPPSAGIFSGKSTDLTPFSEGALGGAGQVNATQGKSRQIQFALRLEF